jgi:hypothetical protein
MRMAVGELPVAGALVSVRPYPSRTVMPQPRKKWPSLAPSGALPENARRTRPPSVARSLL